MKIWEEATNFVIIDDFIVDDVKGLYLQVILRKGEAKLCSFSQLQFKQIFSQTLNIFPKDFECFTEM